ncbi:hypothetical protein BDZ88DRAFT_456590 [Geranomyces variabilis]|nr:hypothetical protein BDZ88DRAFT_456590 [Geranomyces variabilis]
MLTWSRRRYLVEQYYQQTTLWVESAQQRSDYLVQFTRKVEQEIEPNVLPTEFFTSREEDKEKSTGISTTLKVESGAPAYTGDTLKECLEEAKRYEEAKAQEKKETMSPTPPKKPKAEAKLTFEDVLGTSTPQPPEKKAEAKKPLKPKPKPKPEAEGSSVSKKPLLTPEEVAALYKVNPDLLTKILFQAGELKTALALEVTESSVPLKSAFKKEVKPSKPTKKKRKR